MLCRANRVEARMTDTPGAARDAEMPAEMARLGETRTLEPGSTVVKEGDLGELRSANVKAVCRSWGGAATSSCRAKRIVLLKRLLAAPRQRPPFSVAGVAGVAGIAAAGSPGWPCCLPMISRCPAHILKPLKLSARQTRASAQVQYQRVLSLRFNPTQLRHRVAPGQ